MLSSYLLILLLIYNKFTIFFVRFFRHEFSARAVSAHYCALPFFNFPYQFTYFWSNLFLNQTVYLCYFDNALLLHFPHSQNYFFVKSPLDFTIFAAPKPNEIGDYHSFTKKNGGIFSESYCRTGNCVFYLVRHIWEAHGICYHLFLINCRLVILLHKKIHCPLLNPSFPICKLLSKLWS